MKKIRFYSILLFISLFLGCRNDLDRQLYKLSQNKLTDTITTTSSFINCLGNIWENDTVPSERKLNKLALQYYKDVEEAIFLTNSNKISTICNYFKEQLSDLIIKDSNNTRISFFSLSEKHQKAFLDTWVLFQAKQLGEKMKIFPEIKDETQCVAIALEKTLFSQKRFGVNSKTTSTSNDNFFSILEIETENQINSRLNSKFNVGTSIPKVGVCNSKYYNNMSENTEFSSKVIDTLSKYSAAGEFLIRLAIDNNPYIPTNITFNNFGHVGILIGKVSKNVIKKDTISIAASKYGPNGEHGIKKVRYEELHEWFRNFVIVGLQEVEYSYYYDPFTENIYVTIKSTKKITDLSQIKLLAEQQLGKPYAAGWSFFNTRKAAPKKFTCSSLAWWCTKQIFNFEICDYGSWMISPGEIYRNHHVYILAKIKK